MSATTDEPQNAAARAAMREAFLREDYAAALEAYERLDARTTDDNWLAARARGNLVGSVADDIEVDFDTGRAPEVPRRGIDAGLPPPLHDSPPTRSAPSSGPPGAGRAAGGKPRLPRSARVLARVARRLGTVDARRALWDRQPHWLLGLFHLSYWRNSLTEHNLGLAISEAESGRVDAALPVLDFGQRGTADPGWVGRYRTADGTYTTPGRPAEGASGTPFSRHAPAGVDAVEPGPVGIGPDPRHVSRMLLKCEEERTVAPMLNVLSVAWIQFMVHGWADHQAPDEGPVHSLPLEADDPLRRFGATAVAFSRTVAGEDADGAPRCLNRLTHWWDASQLYGSTGDRIRALRRFERGHLDLPEGTLCEYRTSESATAQLTGFNKNWWLGLGLIHLLFAKEHNAICDHLAEAHPDWGEERLFQTARLVNAAVMAKIHTVEWTPAVLAHKALDAAAIANWYGLAQYLSALVRNWFVPAGRRKIRLRTVFAGERKHPILGGLVGGRREDYGVPFSLTEEFVEVYRLHSMLPDALVLPGDDGPAPVPMSELRQSAAATWMHRHPHDALLGALGRQEACALVLNNYPEFLQPMSVPGHPFTDLGTIDVARARERAVPRYNALRRALRLPPARDFDDISECEATQNKLRSVYRDVEEVDLLTGTLAEGYRPKGFCFGETMFMVFVLNASRRLQTDHFFTDGYSEANYSAEGLHWVDEATFKSVLLRHYPDLGDTDLANVDNGFKPWSAST